MRDAKLATYFELARREQHGASQAIRANWQFGHRINCGLDSPAIVTFAWFYSHAGWYIGNRPVGIRVTAMREVGNAIPCRVAIVDEFVAPFDADRRDVGSESRRVHCTSATYCERAGKRTPSF